MSRVLWNAAEFLGALLIAPVLLAWSALSLLLCDFGWACFGKKRLPHDRKPDSRAATVVIPNWNGRDLLEKYLPSVISALAGNPENEILIVDNGSTDGSAEFLRERFPEVAVLALERNHGFGGGSNAGFRAARNPVVVLLNSDMRVEPDFLDPLLAGFTSGDVFAVSCQIFLSDPARRREETGLTEGWWENGRLRVSHRDDAEVTELFPCFYAGGGSSAFDRAKFLELGGFDELLTPFYLEDTDLGFQAWKRGWKVLYQPASVVFHEHRGTIGRKFPAAYIQSVLKKNYLLFAWKNIHEWSRLGASLGAAWAGALASALDGERPLRTNLAGIWQAFLQTGGAVRSRWRARTLSVVSDTEVFQRSRGSHFRDRFRATATPDQRLRVLFVSPYPILPPVHGGAVFMSQTLRELAKTCEVHALVLLDSAEQRESNQALAGFCSSVSMMIRPRNSSLASMRPRAVDEFASRDVRWLIDRLAYQRNIDVIQIEYTPMGQYVERYRKIAVALFEHDVYFQSIHRNARYFSSSVARAKAWFEYLRALRFELKLLPLCDQVQVCTRENREYLLQFDPTLAPHVQAGLRAAIDTHSYAFPGGPRERDSILFVGSARHAPNKVAVQWFLENVYPDILAARPQVRFYLAGFEAESNRDVAVYRQVEMLGYVENVKPLLASCAVFVCPILSGSGVRVKLLEAFASGIPAVSTRIGAEGLGGEDGAICALADDPVDFARKTLALLSDPESGEEMARRARAEVETYWDSAAVTARLIASYRDLLKFKNA